MATTVGFEDLMAPLKQRMDAMQEENRALKAQLAQLTQELNDLKRGVGITVAINGKPIFAGMPVAPDVAGMPLPHSHPDPFAAPAVLNDWRGAPSSGPQQGGSSGSNLFPQAGKQTSVSSTNPGRENQGGQRNGTYADFFLD